MRYFFEIAYKGTNYHGWQIQKNTVSVQQVLTEKLSTILNENVTITGSGRTDTGVHARQQYFHVDIIQKVNALQLMNQLNSFLPSDISIRSIREVAASAHARFDATRRTYEYWIINHKDPFLDDVAYRYTKYLDIENMNEAASILPGEKDFKSFSKIKTDVNHFICEVFEAKWNAKNGILIFRISANRFLRGMVRAITGTLLDIGTRNKKVDDMHVILQSGDRKASGRSVPAKGLCLTEVYYPREIFIT